jgi:hypothetical protein
MWKQSVGSDEEENVSDNSSMHHDIWAKSGAEWPHFLFTGKPGINVDLEDPLNPLDYFEFLLCTRNCGIAKGKTGMPKIVQKTHVI